MEKPNLERLSLIFDPYWAPKSKKIFPQIAKDWEDISEGKISYPENPLLEDFLKEKGIESMLPDFLFMGFMFKRWNQTKEMLIKTKDYNKGLRMELLKALKLFEEYKEGVSCMIRHSKFKVQTEIKNEILVMVIYESLYKYFREVDEVIHFDHALYKKDTSDWGAYLERRIKEIKPKAGRIRGNWHIRRMIFHLWKYLQEYTEFKAMEGTGYSNIQAKFMFDFLKLYGLIENPDSISNEEDYIGNHLKEYRKSLTRKVHEPIFNTL